MTPVTWVICVMFATCMVAILPTTLGQVQQTPVSGCVRRCIAHFGTHYHTFDSTTIGNYFGQCKHLLVGTCEGHCCDNQCCNSKLIPEFKVYLRNKLWFPPFTKPKYVEIHHAGNIVRLSASPLQATWINNGGISITPLPTTYPNFELSSWTTCGYKYTGPAGLTVFFHCSGFVQVNLDMVYWGKTCGMCGNYNFQAADDHYTKDGIGPTTATNIGDSWVVYDPENYNHPCPLMRRRKRAAIETCDGRSAWVNNCTVITDKYARSLDGTFLKEETEECVSGACATGGRSIAEFDSYMAAYASLNTETCLTDAGEVRG